MYKSRRVLNKNILKQYKRMYNSTSNNSNASTSVSTSGFQKSQPKWSSFVVKGSGSGMKTEIQNVVEERNLKDGNKTHKIVMDEPAKLKGTDEGTTPLHVLLSSLAGCENVTAQFVAREMKIKVNKITFDIKGEMDSRGFAGVDAVYSGLQKVRVRAEVDTDATQDQVNELLAQVEKRCPVLALFHKAGVEMDVAWNKSPISKIPSAL